MRYAFTGSHGWVLHYNLACFMQDWHHCCCQVDHLPRYIARYDIHIVIKLHNARHPELMIHIVLKLHKNINARHAEQCLDSLDDSHCG